MRYGAKDYLKYSLPLLIIYLLADFAMSHHKFSFFALSMEVIITTLTIILLKLFNKYTKPYDKKFNLFLNSSLVVFVSFFFMINLIYLFKKFINFFIIVIIFTLFGLISIIVYKIIMKKINNNILQIVKYNPVPIQSFTESYLLNKYKMHLNAYLYDKTPAAVSIKTEGNLNIIINSELYKIMNENEFSALVLHEFAHIKYHHHFKKFLLKFSGAYFFSLSIIIYYGTSYILFFKLALMLASVIYLVLIFVLHNTILLHFEKESDKFALMILHDNSSLIRLINKADKSFIDYYLNNKNGIENLAISDSNTMKGAELRIENINNLIGDYNNETTKFK
ncbi:MAG: M48 family metalloprotease [Ferroplasma sp.]